MNETEINSHLTIALAGNPNAGKTTLFNSLTGLSQKVANYPGVTVERKEGVWSLGDRSVTLIDLPGLYSLDATSLDEQIARDVITGKVEGTPMPDVIVSVVDATNLERNLYLATQLFEFGIPVVIALTMIDVFEKRKHQIDIDRLSANLGVPVIAVNAKAERGKAELGEKVLETVGKKVKIPYELNGGSPDGDNAKIFARYNFISNAVQESVRHNDTREHRISEKIDRVLTHKVFGLAILILILLTVFQAIFSWATLPMDLLEQGFGGTRRRRAIALARRDSRRSHRRRNHRRRRRSSGFLTADPFVISFYFGTRGYGVSGEGGVPSRQVDEPSRPPR